MIARDPRTTPREWQVMLLLAVDRSYDEIGASLGISWHTVRNHVRAVMEKTGTGTKHGCLVALGLLGPGPMLTAPTHRRRRDRVAEGQLVIAE
jgi:DNA-binding CsgD family transcriptional regulator